MESDIVLNDSQYLISIAYSETIIWVWYAMPSFICTFTGDRTLQRQCREFSLPFKSSH